MRVIVGLRLCLLPLPVLLGCQHFEPQALDSAKLISELEQRSQTIEPLAVFADRLQTAGNQAADDFDVADGVSLREAEMIAQAYNADVRLAWAEVARAESVARATGRWDDITIGVSGGRKESETSTSSGQFTAEQEVQRTANETTQRTSYSLQREVDNTIDRSWIASGGLTIVIPLSGRLSAERRARSAEHQAALNAASETEWQITTTLREAWTHWATSIERLRTLEQYVAALAELGNTLNTLSTYGEMDVARARLFQVELVRRQADLHGAALDVDRHRIRILNLMGLLPEAPLNLQPEILTCETPPEAAPDRAAIVANHPSLKRLQAEYATTEALLTVEVRKQFPDITLSPSYVDEAAETILQLGLSMPLPLWNMNRAGIAEALAAREVARLRYERLLQQTLAEVSEARLAWEAARSRRDRMKDDVVPLADQLMAESTRLLHMGELDVVLLYDALIQSFEVKEQLLQAVREESLARTAYNALVTPLTEWNIAPTESLK